MFPGVLNSGSFSQVIFTPFMYRVSFFISTACWFWNPPMNLEYGPYVESYSKYIARSSRDLPTSLPVETTISSCCFLAERNHTSNLPILPIPATPTGASGDITAAIDLLHNHKSHHRGTERQRNDQYFFTAKAQRAQRNAKRKYLKNIISFSFLCALRVLRAFALIFVDTTSVPLW